MAVSGDAHGPDRLPGPGLLPAAWPLRAASMLRDPSAALTRMARRHGGLCAWNPRDPRHVFVFSPDRLREVFSQPDVFVVDSFREFRTPPGSSFDRLGAGLTRLNGAEHRRHRQIMQPPLRQQRVLGHREAVIELTERELRRWRDRPLIRLDQRMSALITEIAVRTVFGVEAPRRADRLRRLVSRFLAQAGSPATLALQRDLPGTPYRRTMRLAEEIEATIREIMAERRRQGAEGSDLLSAMLTARDEHAPALTDDEIVSEAYTAFCHESSASALTWTLFLLDQHPTVLADLRDELDGVLGGRPPDEEDLPKLELLQAVLKESLRLLPPTPLSMRYAAEECELGGYRIPAGATVFYSPYVTHRNAAVFPRAARFDPGRWRTARPTVYEYLPFGAGPHHCVGRHFALLEITIVLSMLLQRHRLSLVPGTRIDRANRMALVPRNGMPMRVLPPSSAAPAPWVRGDIRTSIDLS
ncbi:cytochrome P450 [Marinactinospora thermotolerans]|uniref:cytochrome P450 n=1 Tax=Marinactinospora thermotolerans TaxID=531310 RepID=UPI003D8BD9AC